MKKLALTISFIILVITFTACGKSADTSNPTTDNIAVSQTATTLKAEEPQVSTHLTTASTTEGTKSELQTEIIPPNTNITTTPIKNKTPNHQTPSISQSEPTEIISVETTKTEPTTKAPTTNAPESIQLVGAEDVFKEFIIANDIFSDLSTYSKYYYYDNEAFFNAILKSTADKNNSTTDNALSSLSELIGKPVSDFDSYAKAYYEVKNPEGEEPSYYDVTITSIESMTDKQINNFNNQVDNINKDCFEYYGVDLSSCYAFDEIYDYVYFNCNVITVFNGETYNNDSEYAAVNTDKGWKIYDRDSIVAVGSVSALFEKAKDN